MTSAPRRATVLMTTVLLLSACGSATEQQPTATGSTPAAASSAGAAPSAAPSPSAAASGTASAAPPKYTFPVSGKASYARTHHDYPASDIIAACGLPVRAVVDGTVLEVTRVDLFDPKSSKGEDRGGLSVSILGVDGVRYYGSHLSEIAPGIDAGVPVRSGDLLGEVGKTGNANNTCHLHFGISPACAKTGDWWIRRGVLYPWRYLDAWRAGQNLSPTAEVAAWSTGHGCPPRPAKG